MCGNVIGTLGRSQRILAVSGLKNSGKTTLIERLLPNLQEYGLRTAVIKHDGHEFEADVNGTDSYRFSKAGAYGTAVFSDTKFMLVKQIKHPSESEIMSFFPEADLILLEGFKNSLYKKMEVVRSSVSFESVCDPSTLIALVTDTSLRIEGIPAFSPDAIDHIAKFIWKGIKSEYGKSNRSMYK